MECTKCWIALVARAYHSYTRTLQLSCISWEMWVTARFDVFFKSLNVTKTINIFLAHFRFLKMLQIFSVLLGIMHAASPLPNLHWYPLTSTKNIWPKISIAYFTKWFCFNLYLLLVGGGCILKISLCWPLHTYPHRVVKGPHFEAWTRPEPEITSPNTARALHLFLKPDF